MIAIEPVADADQTRRQLLKEIFVRRSSDAGVGRLDAQASGHVNRIQRPNTWLPRPSLQREDLIANSEQSTHGPKRPRLLFAFASAVGGVTAAPAGHSRGSCWPEAVIAEVIGLRCKTRPKAYSITLSARADSGGISSPSAFAVLRLITN